MGGRRARGEVRRGEGGEEKDAGWAHARERSTHACRTMSRRTNRLQAGARPLPEGRKRRPPRPLCRSEIRRASGGGGARGAGAGPPSCNGLGVAGGAANRNARTERRVYRGGRAHLRSDGDRDPRAIAMRAQAPSLRRCARTRLASSALRAIPLITRRPHCDPAGHPRASSLSASPGPFTSPAALPPPRALGCVRMASPLSRFARVSHANVAAPAAAGRRASCGSAGERARTRQGSARSCVPSPCVSRRSRRTLSRRLGRPARDALGREQIRAYGAHSAVPRPEKSAGRQRREERGEGGQGRLAWHRVSCRECRTEGRERRKHTTNDPRGMGGEGGDYGIGGRWRLLHSRASPKVSRFGLLSCRCDARKSQGKGGSRGRDRPAPGKWRGRDGGMGNWEGGRGK